MTVKLLLLKSGEQVIADVKEMLIGEEDSPRAVGYILNKPCVVVIRKPSSIENEVESNNIQVAPLKISLFPWMPLSKETNIPVSFDWVITMVAPDDKLNAIYTENVVNYGKDNQNISIDEQSNPDQPN